MKDYLVGNLEGNLVDNNLVDIRLVGIRLAVGILRVAGNHPVVGGTRLGNRFVLRGILIRPVLLGNPHLELVRGLCSVLAWFHLCSRSGTDFHRSVGNHWRPPGPDCFGFGCCSRRDRLKWGSVNLASSRKQKKQ